jgi:hypothetical protein
MQNRVNFLRICLRAYRQSFAIAAWSAGGEKGQQQMTNADTNGGTGNVHKFQRRQSAVVFQSKGIPT